jgi:hypothetical protein
MEGVLANDPLAKAAHLAQAVVFTHYLSRGDIVVLTRPRTNNSFRHTYVDRRQKPDRGDVQRLPRNRPVQRHANIQQARYGY